MTNHAELLSDVLGRWPLIGRDDELTLIRGVIRGRAPVVIAGESGVGKTALARAVVADVAAEGWSTEWAVAYGSATAVPFAALAGMLPPEAIGADRDQLLRATVDALAARRGRGNLLVAVDDAHLLDDASAALIALLATTETCSLLVTIRSREPLPEPVAALARPPGIRLDLQALSFNEAEMVLERALDGHLDPSSARGVIDMAAGNMLYLRELVVGGLGAEHLVREDGMWRWRGRLVPTPGLRQQVSDRLAHLSAAERRSMEVVAVGEPIDPRVLTTLVATTVLQALDACELVELHESHGVRAVRTAHPLYGEVIRSELSLLRSGEIGVSLADAYERRGELSDDDAVRVTRWRLEAGDRMAPPLLLQAARRLLALSDPMGAEEIASRAVEFGGSIDAQVVVAQALTRQGRATDAVALLETLDGETDEQRHLIAFELSGLHLLYLAEPDKAAAVLAAAEAKVVGPAARHMLMADRASLSWARGRLDEALEISDPLRAEGVDERVRVRAALISVTVRMLEGEFLTSVAEARNIADAADRYATEMPWARPQLDLASLFALSMAGEPRAALTEARARYERTLTGNDSFARAIYGHLLGFIQLQQGRVRSAVRHLEEAVVLNRESGGFFIRPSLAHLASARAMSGDLGGAEASMHALDELTVGVPVFDQTETARARACVAALGGELRRAQEIALAAAKEAASVSAWTLAMLALHDAARWGAPRPAAALLVDVAPHVDGKLRPLIAEYMASLASNDADALDAVSRQFEEVGFTLYAAEAAADAGLGYAALSRNAPAAAANRRADRLVGECENAITPALRRRKHSPLSPREEEVAVLATNGLGDREIAERLHLSVRTVHAHLRNIYTKLGVTSRDQLQRQLDG
jgi:DNA-binding CsgD family transcriptional regulator